MKTRTNIYLRPDQMKRLKAISKRTGSSAAELIRRAVDAFLEKEEEKKNEAGGSVKNFPQFGQRPALIPRAAIHDRVSTLNGQNPDVQTREIEEYCQRRGFEIFSVYVAKVVSG